MNIPGKVKIGGFIYEISEIENLCRDRRNQGESCNNDLTITLEKSLPRPVKESTFIHEIIEQLNDVYMINLEHKQIYDLEAGIYAFIKDNPNVFNEKSIQNTIGIGIKIDDDIAVDDLVDKATNKFVTEFRKTLQKIKR